jgi:hypothetical protein
MSDKDTPLGRFSAIQTRELLTIGSSPAETAETSLYEVGDCERLEMLLTDMCSGTGQSGATLLEAVCSPDTEVNVLVAVKDIAKRFAADAQDMPQKAAATLLYHLSVASALGYHGQTISSMGVAERLPLYRELVSELSEEALVVVFEKAISSVAPGQT